MQFLNLETCLEVWLSGVKYSVIYTFDIFLDNKHEYSAYSKNNLNKNDRQLPVYFFLVSAPSCVGTKYMIKNSVYNQNICTKLHRVLMQMQRYGEE